MKTGPRIAPNRDEFYLGMALWYAGKSKDPSTQCGAVIISADNKPLGWGYNGPPKSIDDNLMDWSRPAKYAFIKHAERNAIKHACGDLCGSTIYVTARPCPDCMLEIADFEIAKVVYYPYAPRDDESSMLRNDKLWQDTENIANQAGVELVEFSDDLDWMIDRYNWMIDAKIFGDK